MIDADRRITFATDSIEPLLGHQPATLSGQDVGALVDPGHRSRLADLLAAAHRMPDATAGELMLRHRDGHAVHADVRFADRLEDADVAGVVLTVHDVSERRRLETELQESAVVDRHTGLANRARFDQWLQAALARGAEVATLLIALDDFKAINDSLGHSAGDRVLALWAHRLRGAVGDRGRLARLAGDEFISPRPDGVHRGPTHARVARARSSRELKRAVRLDGRELLVTRQHRRRASERPATSPRTSLQCADTALYAAKTQGRDTVSSTHRRCSRARVAR